MNSPYKQYKQQQGFSLLEILVAFSILAMSLGVLFQIYSRGIQTTALASDYTNAVIIAQSQLAAIDELETLELTEEQGSTEQGIEWHLRISAYDGEDNSIFNERYELVNVEVEVNWQTLGKPRSFMLKSLRIKGMK